MIPFFKCDLDWAFCSLFCLDTCIGWGRVAETLQHTKGEVMLYTS